MKKIFIAEDDENIRELLAYALENSGFSTVAFPDGSQVMEAVLKTPPNLIILDIMMPIMDGMTLLSKLKSNPKTAEIPVIMLTAKATELDKIKGLDTGADDYITKPFSVMELISRVKVVLRRVKSTDEGESLQFGDITINKEQRAVSVESQEISLTYKEYELLVFLIENRGKVLSRNQIINSVWDYAYAGESRTVDMHIKSLRKKLLSCGNYVVTVRNVGYVAKLEE